MHRMSAGFGGIESERESERASERASEESAVGDRLSQSPSLRKTRSLWAPFVSSWIIIQSMTTELMKARIVS